MEHLEVNEVAENSFFSNAEINAYLLETAKWSKFLAIVGYVGMGILVLIGISMMVGLSLLSEFSGGSFPMGMLGLVYIFLAAIYFFPVNYLYQFSTQIKVGLVSKEIQTVASAFKNLKSVFKFMGMFTIIILSIYALALVVALPIALLFFK